MRIFLLSFFLLASACAKDLPREPAGVKSEIKAEGNSQIDNFGQAKKLLLQLHKDHAESIYCPCKYQGKSFDLRTCGYKVHKDPRRAARLEWEHVVPAEAFGQAFAEWRVGSDECVKKNGKRYRGRKCAEKNPAFDHMEADLYNLWPIVGELNGLRSNYSMAAISGEAMSFGDCTAKIQDRKFEPMDAYKGIVARTYLYMNAAYPGRGIVSDKNDKLFAAWDKQYPVGDWECERASRIRKLQGNENPILATRCENRPGSHARP